MALFSHVVVNIASIFLVVTHHERLDKKEKVQWHRGSNRIGRRGSCSYLACGVWMMERRVQDLWKLNFGFEMLDLDKGYFIAHFHSKGDYLDILGGRPWIVLGQYLTVSKWSPNSLPSMDEEAPQRNSTWSSSTGPTHLITTQPIRGPIEQATEHTTTQQPNPLVSNQHTSQAIPPTTTTELSQNGGENLKEKLLDGRDLSMEEVVLKHNDGGPHMAADKAKSFFIALLVLLRGDFLAAFGAYERQNQCKIKVLATNDQVISLALATIYASPTENFCRELSDYLCKLGDCICFPWLLLGDFNQWCYMATPYWNFIDHCKPIDLGFSGPKFTWTNSRSGAANILERIDR
ncbi:hypothetical protein M9H77_35385 [Catharanthus roseus]|uniref:Uncharacterized protein n=1 Tax=Catharanthus roseus TaxID=4058 RepID=A0ACB9ZPM2_CATRO|nr:hypothetical protein M9H77_35385 [Catharanthus roseus]